MKYVSLKNIAMTAAVAGLLFCGALRADSPADTIAPPAVPGSDAGPSVGGDAPPRRAGNAAANELVKTGQFYFPRLQFQTKLDVPKKWNIHPIGDQKLRDAVRKLTNINILTDPVVVNLDSPDDLMKYPFVFMTSEGDFTFSDKNLKTFRDYLERGGFLYADDCVALQQYDHFYNAFVREVNRAFPDNPMRPIPMDHEVFHCFYQLDAVPFCQGIRHPAMGLFDKNTGRLMAMVTSGDIHCGWVGFGNLDRQECEKSIYLGVNVIVYSLTH